MQERCAKVDVNLSWHLVWLFALLEGITVPLVPLFLETGPNVKSTAHPVLFATRMAIIGVYGVVIGFVGALIVSLLLNYVAFGRLKIRLNGAVIVRVTHPIAIGLWGGLLLALIFWIQQCIGGLLVFSPTVNLMLLGFVSAAGAIIFTTCVYLPVAKAAPRLRIQLHTTEQRLALSGVPIVSFAVLVGLYEGLAAPILHQWESAPQHKVLIALVVGLAGGALSSLIVVALAHMSVVKKHMWLEFSVMSEYGNGVSGARYWD